jgi:hypothetical protein
MGVGERHRRPWLCGAVAVSRISRSITARRLFKSIKPTGELRSGVRWECPTAPQQPKLVNRFSIAFCRVLRFLIEFLMSTSAISIDSRRFSILKSSTSRRSLSTAVRNLVA